MKRVWIIVAAAAVFVVACFVVLYLVDPFQLGTSIADQETVFQVGAFEPFARGEYDGDVTYGELAKHGDFGLGTLNGLDGEMVALDGVFYQVPTSGVPRQIGDAEETPFALVTFFESDKTVHVAEAMNYSELKVYIDQLISPEDALYAIKVSGDYSYAQTRSVPAQTKPYPELTEVIEQQTVFNLADVAGTAVGFRLPSYMGEINVSGYHMHFISDDELSGGHLLDCIIENVTIEIDVTYDYELVLLENP